MGTAAIRGILHSFRLLGICLSVGLLAGGECGAPAPTVPNQVDSWNPGPGGSTTDPAPGIDNDGGTSHTSDDGTAPDVGQASLLLDGVTGAVGGDFDIYDGSGTALLSGEHAAETPVAIEPGTYVLKQAGNSAFVLAASVVVEPDRLTIASIGAVEVRTVSGATFGLFDLYDAGSGEKLSEANDPNVPVSAPAGTYLLRQSFNDTFAYAQNVMVIAGATTTVSLGAIQIESVPGSVGAGYDIFNSTGVTLLSEGHEPNVAVTAPAGTYVLKQYFNESLVFAGGVSVSAGSTRVIRLGAIRYNGSVAFDLYTGTGAAAQSLAAGEIQSVPAGTYWLYEYFTTQLLAGPVVVQEGQITDVP